jgi:hypothetical protein
VLQLQGGFHASEQLPAPWVFSGPAETPADDEIKGVHQMKRLHAMTMAALIAIIGTAAIAQTKPGGNVPTGQGPCAQGYDTAAPNGRMRLRDDTMRQADLNNDGNISRSEFNAACAKGLFDDAKDG